MERKRRKKGRKELKWWRRERERYFLPLFTITSSLSLFFCFLAFLPRLSREHSLSSSVLFFLSPRVSVGECASRQAEKKKIQEEEKKASLSPPPCSCTHPWWSSSLRPSLSLSPPLHSAVPPSRRREEEEDRPLSSLLSFPLRGVSEWWVRGERRKERRRSNKMKVLLFFRCSVFLPPLFWNYTYIHTHVHCRGKYALKMWRRKERKGDGGRWYHRQDGCSSSSLRFRFEWRTAVCSDLSSSSARQVASMDWEKKKKKKGAEGDDDTIIEIPKGEGASEKGEEFCRTAPSLPLSLLFDQQLWLSPLSLFPLLTTLIPFIVANSRIASSTTSSSSSLFSPSVTSMGPLPSLSLPPVECHRS